MSNQVKSAVIHVVGSVFVVLIGVCIFTNQVKTEKRIERVTEAYRAYLGSVGRCSEAQRRDEGFDPRDAKRAVEEELAALGIIAIYGNAEVVKAVSVFEGRLSDPEDEKRILKAVELMREHVGAEKSPAR